ncbi:MAG TPA: 1-acyl-sn-glycerol-3-phosphate acyltransferase, partial [Clostridiales bacterium]|nr:1-acyl-sn-glycerol-3-phosphate acyltransferase [Clostridiales bacterium]
MLYWFLRILVLPFYRLIYRQKVYGRENLPKDGKVIIIGNHYSKADVFMMS